MSFDSHHDPSQRIEDMLEAIASVKESVNHIRAIPCQPRKTAKRGLQHRGYRREDHGYAIGIPLANFMIL